MSLQVQDKSVLTNIGRLIYLQYLWLLTSNLNVQETPTFYVKLMLLLSALL